MDYLKDSPAVIRDFLIYMESIVGRSEKTVNGYFLDLRIFFRYIICSRGLAEFEDFDNVSIDDIDLDFVSSVQRSEVLEFLVFLSRSRPKYHSSSDSPVGNQPRAISRKMSALRSFYKFYCDKKRLLNDNPTKDIETAKAKHTLPKFLSLQESIDLLSSVDGPYKERDYCILTLFLNCGLRVSEMVNLNLKDITDEQIRVIGKGNKERVVYLNEACKAAIENYIPVRLTPKSTAKSALFISREGNRINVQTVKWLVKKYLSKSGLSAKNYSVHKLRHTAATLMYQNGVDVRTLKDVLGHESLNTTMIYTHVIDDDLKHAAAANPLANIKPSQKKEEE